MAKKIHTANWVSDVTVIDPDTKSRIDVSIYKHENSGGMFGVDTSFLEQNFDDDEIPMVADPFNNEAFVELHESFIL